MNPQPKPEPRRVAKARKLRRLTNARAACENAVWTRARSHCERCGVFVYRPHQAPWFGLAGAVHETQLRSLGADPTDPAQCELLCFNCHFSGPSGAHVGRR
jgi:hypothetical protein